MWRKPVPRVYFSIFVSFKYTWDIPLGPPPDHEDYPLRRRCPNTPRKNFYAHLPLSFGSSPSVKIRCEQYLVISATTALYRSLPRTWQMRKGRSEAGCQCPGNLKVKDETHLPDRCRAWHVGAASATQPYSLTGEKSGYRPASFFGHVGNGGGTAQDHRYRHRT